MLAEQLTYICKAEDGVIRRVTMDYSSVDTEKEAEPSRLINDLELPVFELDDSEVGEALKAVSGGDRILRLIEGKSWEDENDGNGGNSAAVDDQQEFGGLPATLERQESKTWTLVVLSDLKPTGRNLKIGILRRMLSAALPIGTDMCIRVNGKRLRSTKMNAALLNQWVIGPELEIDYIELDETDAPSEKDNADGPSEDDAGEAESVDSTQVEIKAGSSPYPYVELPEVGRVTGLVRLYQDRISGGKSDERGASNGFHVNVLGRVVNQIDPSFGEENLNHAAWARFRMTVRADGLNEFLTTNREQFKERRGLKIFRAFLRRAFNKARSVYDSDKNAMMPDGGDVLVQSLGVVSLSPLRNVVSETLESESPIPGLFDESGITDREAKRRSWGEDTAENIRNALGQVKYENMDDDSFVKFRIRDSAVVVNSKHPFVLEHSGSKVEKELVRTVAMVDMLADVYALDIGVEPSRLESVRGYRDKLMRFRALQRRSSGVHIAQLLQKTQHESLHWKRFEVAVGDALSYLGFDILNLGQPGKPEGIARAFSMPSRKTPTQENLRSPLYSFSFDAKSSKHEVAKTGNIPLDAVVQHRDEHKANHALVVAPGFSDGSLVKRCQKQEVTPMIASDLGKLLEYTAEYGAIPLTIFREVFALFDPIEVSGWVADLEGKLDAGSRLTIDIFIKALDKLKGKVPDALAPALIAYTCRDSLDALEVQDTDVLSLVKGLEVIVPDLVGVGEDNSIVVNASASHVASAIAVQLEKIHGEGGTDDG